MIAWFQDIPDVDGFINASNAFIVDQGVALFALVVFTIVIFGMMAIIFMMQRQFGAMLRQMGKESNQQDKLITQNDLNRDAAQRNTDEIIDVKQLLAQLIEIQTKNDDDKNAIVKDGIASIDKNTESVTKMTMEFDHLKNAIETKLEQLISGKGMKLSDDTQQSIVDALAKQLMPHMEQCLKDAVKRITQETKAVQPNDTEKVEAPKIPQTPKAKEEDKPS